MMQVDKNDKVGLIAARNFQAAAVFNFHGIDFYSKGERTLEHACLDHRISMTAVIEDLEELKANPDLPDFLAMDLTRLSVHILRTHHKFAEKKIVFIKHTLERLARERTQPGSKVEELSKRFDELSIYLRVHMKHEEFIIFPFIQAIAKGRARHFSDPSSIEQPIKAMTDDHLHEVAMLRKLGELTNNYLVPPNADYALRITYTAMKELEDDLKIHMHLENNILFPKAVDLTDAALRHVN
jgi:regulator of cell morphogenesis and NO signaling